jgi:hypothetical protein
MAEQTAVEFLIESIDARGLWTKELRKEAKQAKQMEREQHKDTWDAGMSEGIGTTMGSLDYDGEFINYYNETYGK